MEGGYGSGGSGAEGTRTPDFLLAKEALSQLSYSPTPESSIGSRFLLVKEYILRPCLPVPTPLL